MFKEGNFKLYFGSRFSNSIEKILNIFYYIQQAEHVAFFITIETQN